MKQGLASLLLLFAATGCGPGTSAGDGAADRTSIPLESLACSAANIHMSRAVDVIEDFKGRTKTQDETVAALSEEADRMDEIAASASGDPEQNHIQAAADALGRMHVGLADGTPGQFAEAYADLDRAASPLLDACQLG